LIQMRENQSESPSPKLFVGCFQRRFASVKIPTQFRACSLGVGTAWSGKVAASWHGDGEGGATVGGGECGQAEGWHGMGRRRSRNEGRRQACLLPLPLLPCPRPKKSGQRDGRTDGRTDGQTDLPTPKKNKKIQKIQITAAEPEVKREPPATRPPHAAQCGAPLLEAGQRLTRWSHCWSMPHSERWPVSHVAVVS